MKVTFDFSEFDKFAENLKDSYKIETALMTATQNIAKVLHKILLEQTPVDTGNLRKMWSAGENLVFTVERVENGYEVVLTNEAEYATAVNDGHYS